VGPSECGAAEAAGRAEESWTVVPRPTADDTATCIAALKPGRTVRWRAFVLVVVNILNPFPNVAGHVVKAERIWFERSYWRRLLAIPWTAAAAAIGVGFANVIAPVIAGLGSSPRGIFPFARILQMAHKFVGG